jgi:hypothetical protein
VSFLKPRPEGGEYDSSLQAKYDSGSWGTLYPALCEHLCESQWPGGKPRTTSTITLFCEHGRWKACVRDRHQLLNLFVTASTPEALLGAVEAALVSDSSDWRADKSTRPRPRI